MTKICLIILLTCLGCSGYAQQFMTRNGFIGFYSQTPLEDIKAENNQVYAIIDAGKKNLAFTLLLKGFIFRKELMQEHFNENYVESDKYPKANFVGNYTGDMPLDRNGVYHITVRGSLSLHNVTKTVEVPATLEVNNGKLTGFANFNLMPEDFNISIPSLVRDKIAKEINVKVQIDCTEIK